MLSLVLLAALISGWAHSGNPASRGPKSAASSLKALTCNSDTSCELQLVADDWDGSGTWTARTGTNAAAAAIPVKGNSANFKGRTSIDMTIGCFLLPSGNDNITSTSTKSYELVVDDFGSTNSQYLLTRRDGANAQIADWVYKNSATSLESVLYNAAVGVYLGATPITLTDVGSKPVFFTVTVDVAGASMITYQNGTVVNTSSSASGVLTSNVAVGLGIGCRWNAGAREGAFAGKILEVLRHNTVLTPTQITARTAQFNRLKGY